MSIRRVVYNGCIIILCSILWVILNETINLFQLVLGSILGFIAIFMSENYFTLTNYSETYRIKPVVLIQYTLYLFYQIFYAGFATTKLIITGKVNPGIVVIETALEDDFKRCMLANSITLTPGTVTIDSTDNKLTVLWINCETEDPVKAGEIIKGKFESILLKG